MAIIALKEIEEAAIEAGKFSRAEADSKQNSLDQQLGALYGEGIGERAYPHVSTFPKFKYVLPEEAAQDSNSGKDAVEVYRETLARKHEAIAVHEFKEHLDYNMKRVRLQESVAAFWPLSVSHLYHSVMA